MDKITDNLYITDLDHVKQKETMLLPQLFVLNLSGDETAECDVYYPLRDGAMDDQMRFDGAVVNLLKHLRHGETCVVYCAAGVSRSVTVAAAALAEMEDTNWVDAFQKIKEKRPVANPNPRIKQHALKFLGEKLHDE